MAETELLSLGEDALRNVLRRLDVQSVLACRASCRVLQVLADEDGLWTQLWKQSLISDPAYAALRDVPVERLQAFLRLQSVREVFEACTRLGTWPEGIWIQDVPEEHALNPAGCLVQVSLRDDGDLGPRLHGEVIDWQPEDPWGQNVGGRLLSSAAFSILFNGPSGHLVEARGHRGDSADPSCRAVLRAHHGRAGSLEVIWVAAPVSQGASRWAGCVKRLSLGDTVVKSHLYDYVGLPPPPPLPWALAPLPSVWDPIAVLARLQGYWKACYGSHGFELIDVSLADTPLEAPPDWPAGHTTLVGLKATGDLNVPAEHVTFVVDPASGQAGPGAVDWRRTYGRHTPARRPAGWSLDNSPIGTPALCYERGTRVQPDKMLLLDGVFLGMGQINAIPSRWAPEWEPLQLYTYSGTTPCFSILWDDSGRRYRHWMNFTPIPCARGRLF